MAPFCYGTVYVRVSYREDSHIRQNSVMFFYVVHMQHFEAKPCVIYAEKA